MLEVSTTESSFLQDCLKRSMNPIVGAMSTVLPHVALFSCFKIEKKTKLMICVYNLVLLLGASIARITAANDYNNGEGSTSNTKHAQD